VWARVAVDAAPALRPVALAMGGSTPLLVLAAMLAGHRRRLTQRALLLAQMGTDVPQTLDDRPPPIGPLALLALGSCLSLPFGFTLLYLHCVVIGRSMYDIESGWSEAPDLIAAAVDREGRQIARLPLTSAPGGGFKGLFTMAKPVIDLSAASLPIQEVDWVLPPRRGRSLGSWTGLILRVLTILALTGVIYSMVSAASP
jgi:hypothetical protein